MASSMTVPLLDLRTQFSAIREEVLHAITEVCDTQGLSGVTIRLEWPQGVMRCCSR